MSVSVTRCHLGECLKKYLSALATSVASTAMVAGGRDICALWLLIIMLVLGIIDVAALIARFMIMLLSTRV